MASEQIKLFLIQHLVKEPEAVRTGRSGTSGMWPTSLGRSGSRIARLLLKGMSRPMWEYSRLLSILPVSCSQAQANIVAGCCLVMGLKFAGSANQEAFKCLVCSALTVIRAVYTRENKPLWVCKPRTEPFIRPQLVQRARELFVPFIRAVRGLHKTRIV